MIMPVHGGEVFRLAAEAGLQPEEIIDFSANINPLGLPPGVRESMLKALDGLANYPEIGAESLRQAIAQRHRLPAADVIVGNGSTALIYLLARALRPKKVLLWAPTFTEYERAFALARGRVFNLLSWSEGEPHTLDKLLKKSLEYKAELIFICNPNNPTGSLRTPEELEKIISGFAKAGTICVIDEAFIDFVGADCSFAERVKEFDNLLVLRSLTKIYALAGLRCGYLLAGEKLAREIGGLLEPWSLNSIAMAAATTALKNDKNFMAETIALIEQQRNYLTAALSALDWLEIFPSRVNYLLARLARAIDIDDLKRFLFSREKILVRSCADYFGLGREYMRFAVKGEMENLRLIKALQAYR
ncbi:MAG TPA: threonine-phosphate decarboxylase [Proteobacteria bacterium]|nr:threonine-phosphate decarboxylase [Pseudomonadota bacterium]